MENPSRNGSFFTAGAPANCVISLDASDCTQPVLRRYWGDGRAANPAGSDAAPARFISKCHFQIS
jgi:hypothetical protein